MKGNTNLNLSREVHKIEERLGYNQEKTLCKGLKQPFANTNSGSRKIMHGIQLEQATPLLNPEVPIISTGYENQFGEYSSNFIEAEKDYVVVAKVPKFKDKPNMKYWLIVLDPLTDELGCIERVSYHHITEFYGYLYNNDYLDNLNVGDAIKKGDVIKKTYSYDEYNNRAEGINLTTMYIACEDVTEDPIVISESAAKRFMTPLIENVEIKINDNDILLNLYGKDKEYKTFPDIGEKINNSILCVVRRELKDEEALFSQSWDRLKQIMMSDKKFIAEGTVIDIDVYCNNPDKLNNSMYNNQIKKYHDEQMDFCNRFAETINQIIFDKEGNRNSIKMTYDLQKMYYKTREVAKGRPFINDKVFNNITMVVYIRRDMPIYTGDKITDRYGGKGVISKVIPDSLMPHYLKDGQWHPVDVLYSMCTCINRLNDGQLFETSITYVGWQLIEYIKNNRLSLDDAYKLILKYVEILSPEEAQMMREAFDYNDESEELDYRMGNSYYAGNAKYLRDTYVQNILDSGYILLSLKPISSKMNIFKLRDLYNALPFIKKHCPVCAPIKDSNGNYRMVYTRRQVVIGYKYIFRLKQFAEEKFSGVSLASTNIRNENSKSRMSKTHNAKFASTPVRVYGEMESSTLTSHLGVNAILEEFMLSSSSPMARRLHSQLLTGDPFEFNIKLDKECISQSADIGQAYLKTIGLKFRFVKLRKFKKQAVLRRAVSIIPRRERSAVVIVPKEIRDDEEKTRQFIKDYKDKEEKILSTKLKEAVEIIPGIKEERERTEAYEAKLKRLRLKK